MVALECDRTVGTARILLRDAPEAPPAGRLYAFSNYNPDNLRAVQRTDGVMEKRVHTLGYFVFKYSDEHGKTWSKERCEIPIRETAVDRGNIYGRQGALLLARRPTVDPPGRRLRHVAQSWQLRDARGIDAHALGTPTSRRTKLATSAPLS